MRKFALAFLCLVATLGMYAQNFNDVVRYSRPDDIGSARYMALGGAFSALGNDFGAVSMNPAGIAVYRHPEVSFSTYYRNTNSSTNHYGEEAAWRDGQLRFSQIGIVLHGNVDHDSHVNFGVRYHRTNDFGFEQRVDASNINSSVLEQWEGNANFFLPNGGDLYGAGLIYEGLAEEVGLLDYQNNRWNRTAFGSSIRQRQVFNSSGGKGVFGIDLGVQSNNRWNVGVSLEVPSVIYSYDEVYTESNYDAGSSAASMEWFNNYSIFGIGFQLKAGVIFTPEKYGRFSAYLHSPTWWAMTQEGESQLTSNFMGGGSSTGFQPFNTYVFNMTTPMKLGVGYAYVFDKFGLISFDYAIQAMGFASVESPDFPGELDFINQDIDNFLTTWHDLRLGTEWRMGKLFYRGGVHYTTSAFIDGDDFAAQLAGGVGYKENKWGMDFTYSRLIRRNEFYLYAPELVEATSRTQVGHFFITSVYFRL